MNQIIKLIFLVSLTFFPKFMFFLMFDRWKTIKKSNFHRSKPGLTMNGMWLHAQVPTQPTFIFGMWLSHTLFSITGLLAMWSQVTVAKNKITCVEIRNFSVSSVDKKLNYLVSVFSQSGYQGFIQSIWMFGRRHKKSILQLSFQTQSS